jgi:hypothetical protein
MIFKEIGCEDVDWNGVAENRVKFLSDTSDITTGGGGGSLTSCATGSFVNFCVDGGC